MTEIFKSDLLGEHYTRFLHASGLPIYVFPKKMTSTYALFATDFGAVDTAPIGESGLVPPSGVAHFLEHKLFECEDGSDAFEHFSALGADANAYTSHTRTVYLFSSTEHFSEALGELIDFVTHPFFTKKSVKKEQGIIAEEIRMCRDNPYDTCYYNMLEGLYKDHPVKTDICGSVASIGEITPEVLYTVYNTYYTPENMALVICGDVTMEEVLRVVDRHLPRSYTAGTTPPRVTVEEAPEAHRARVSAKGQVAKPIFSIGFKDTRIPTEPVERLKRDAAMAILCEMLFSEAGELYNALFDEGLISPELSSDYALTRDFAFVQLSGEAGDPELVLSRVLDALERIKKEGLSAEDFERCRRIEYAEYIKSFDNTEEIANTLLSFVFEGAELFSYAEVLQSIDLEFVNALLCEVFCPSHVTLSVIFPKEEV